MRTTARRGNVWKVNYQTFLELIHMVYCFIFSLSLIYISSNHCRCKMWTIAVRSEKYFLNLKIALNVKWNNPCAIWPIISFYNKPKMSFYCEVSLRCFKPTCILYICVQWYVDLLVAGLNVTFFTNGFV